MSTSRPDRGGPGSDLRRVDAAVRQTVALLELVAQEEAVLARLAECARELQAIRQARTTLLEVTDAEVAEADALLGRAEAEPPTDGPADQRGGGRPVA